jgi:hypothetical protein
MEPINSILGTVNLIQAVQSSYQAISDLSARGLPRAFALAADDLPLIKDTLDVAGDALHNQTLSADVSAQINECLSACWQSTQALQSIFIDVAAEDGKAPVSADGGVVGDAREYYLDVLRSRGSTVEGNRVEDLMSEVLRRIQQLITIPLFVEPTERHAADIQSALDALAEGEPSATDSDLATS